ncbi:nitrous oxide reductase accessory protein NosL [Sulfurihydrogenibium subterraneum]|uniref:nitrous oxide reductase accessory protein NosL n=1 Tax=Sulfurihydrogenibium subterraneum TaxID=171121 RepID=UPI0004909F84|nr:nitrous oxide reductase accessory protein NosL [Sulfurihydrogenibium subterraneum]
MRWILALILVVITTSFGQPKDLQKEERCPICGMSVSPKDKLLSQVKLKDGSYKFAESPKHILKFYFLNQDKASEIWVKDYNTGKWIDGRLAYYVIIQDGPMGPDLAPFSTKLSATKFSKKEKVYSFKDITRDLIEKLDTHTH